MICGSQPLMLSTSKIVYLKLLMKVLHIEMKILKKYTYFTD